MQNRSKSFAFVAMPEDALGSQERADINKWHGSSVPDMLLPTDTAPLNTQLGSLGATASRSMLRQVRTRPEPAFSGDPFDAMTQALAMPADVRTSFHAALDERARTLATNYWGDAASLHKLGALVARSRWSVDAGLDCPLPGYGRYMNYGRWRTGRERVEGLAKAEGAAAGISNKLILDGMPIVDAQESPELVAAVRAAIVNSPGYRLLLNLERPPLAPTERPLSSYWRGVRHGMVTRDIQSRFGGPSLAELLQDPGARRMLDAAKAGVDDELRSVRWGQTASEEGLSRVRAYFTRALNRSYNEISDQPPVTMRTAEIFVGLSLKWKNSDLSDAVERLASQINGHGFIDAPDSAYLIERIGEAFRVDAAEVWEENRSLDFIAGEVLAYVPALRDRSSWGSDYIGELNAWIHRTPLPKIDKPKTLQFAPMQQASYTTREDKERLTSESIGTLLHDARTAEDHTYRRHARLIIAAPADETLPLQSVEPPILTFAIEAAALDERFGANAMPFIPGFRLSAARPNQTRWEFDFVRDRPEGHDPYQRCPWTMSAEGWRSRQQAIAADGYPVLGKSLAQTSDRSFAGLAELIEQEGRYFMPESSAEAYLATIAGRPLPQEGRPLLQCDSATDWYRELGDPEPGITLRALSGWALPEGAGAPIVRMGHRQVQVGNGKQAYIVDPTPRTYADAFVAADLSQEWLDMLSRRMGGGYSQQLDSSSSLPIGATALQPQEAVPRTVSPSASEQVALPEAQTVAQSLVSLRHQFLASVRVQLGLEHDGAYASDQAIVRRIVTDHAHANDVLGRVYQHLARAASPLPERAPLTAPSQQVRADMAAIESTQQRLIRQIDQMQRRELLEARARGRALPSPPSQGSLRYTSSVLQGYLETLEQLRQSYARIIQTSGA